MKQDGKLANKMKDLCVALICTKDLSFSRTALCSGCSTNEMLLFKLFVQVVIKCIAQNFLIWLHHFCDTLRVRSNTVHNTWFSIMQLEDEWRLILHVNELYYRNAQQQLSQKKQNKRKTTHQRYEHNSKARYNTSCVSIDVCIMATVIMTFALHGA